MTTAATPPWARLRDQWGLDGFDESFARLMWRLAGPQPPPSLLVAVCALSRGLARGQGCIDLAQPTGLPASAGESMPVAPAPVHWREELLATPVVGRPGTCSPLVLDAQDRLYLYRYWHYEQQLVQDIQGRAAPLLPTPAGLGAALQEWFAPGPGVEAMRLAAATAVLKPLCIVSGRPGTGKTVTTLRILALLLRLAEGTPPRIALAAPTGKAAVRLQAALRDAMQGLPTEVQPQLEAPAQHAGTLHRLLGARADGGFVHGPDRPLRLDVLVVDEASMIDLSLMWRLLRALPAAARLIFVGDRDQLASVQPGAVFHALCQPARARSASLARELRPLGVEFPSARRTEPSVSHALGDCTVELRHNFRFAADSGIAALADAVRRGDADAALRVLDAPPPDLGFHVLEEDAAGPSGLDALPLEWYQPPDDPTDTDTALAGLRRLRILALQREGPWGVEGLNAYVRARCAPTAETWYPGRQVLVLQNRPGLNLYNGDLGVALRRGDGDELRVVFPATAPQPREFSPYRLPPHEDAYAMTVHKSQGSEFDQVGLILPPRLDHPLLNRRLLYTALTRARKRVDLWATPAAVRTAVLRDTSVVSGLGAQLTAATTPSSS